MPIYEYHSRPLGKSFEEWSSIWWSWFISIPKINHPVYDCCGNYALVNQEQSRVVFLCQTIESADTFPKRFLKIKHGSFIFMPIINWVSVLHVDGENDSQLTETAKNRMDVVGRMEVIVGDVCMNTELLKYRFSTFPIDVHLPVDNVLDRPPGLTRIVGDGYWIFTKPIVRETSIKTYGTCSAGVRLELRKLVWNIF
jgi:hypothetical protein